MTPGEVEPRRPRADPRGGLVGDAQHLSASDACNEAPRRVLSPLRRMTEERLLSYHRFTREHGVNWPLYVFARAILQPVFLIYLRLTADRPRARQGPGAADRRRQPPQLPRPVRDRRLAALAAAAALRRQGRAVRAPLAGLAPEPARRLPGAPRPVRRGDADHLPRGARARRRDLHLPRGDADPHRLAGPPQARLRPPRARDRAPPCCRSPSTAPSRSAAGWWIRPRKVKVRAGRALTFPRTESPSPALANSVGARIWPVIELQWEWLGGLPPLRKAAVIGAGSWGTAVAVLLARGGLEVQLGCRTAEQAEEMPRPRTNERYLPGVPLPDGLTVKKASEIELAGMDLVCLGVPSKAAAGRGRLDRRPRRPALGGPDAEQGPGGADGRPPLRLRRRAGPLPRGRLPRRPRPRQGGRLGDGRAGAGQRRRRPAQPARRGLRRGGPGLRAHRRHHRGRDGRRRQERRRASRPPPPSRTA